MPVERSEQTPLIRELREAASEAYDGWSGWHFSWHWQTGMGTGEDDMNLARKIGKEARKQIPAMRAEINRLEARISQCEDVARMSDRYIAAWSDDE